MYKLRINRRAGKEKIQHKPVIVPSDLAKIRASPFLSMTTPAGLLRKTWFYVSFYWCRREREGQRDLRRDSFKFTRDASGREYAVMTHEEATKNHPGSPQQSEKQGFTVLEKMMMHLPRSESFCVKIKSVVLSVFPTSKAKREYWKRRLVRKQTTGCQQVRRNDENYICWSEALSNIHQPFRSGVCHNHALWRECSRPSHYVHFRA